MLYLLSRLVPVPMYSEYREGESNRPLATSWWQWRDRCFRIRTWLRPE